MLEITNPSQQATEISAEDKLKALFKLQYADSQIDKIKTLRGELQFEEDRKSTRLNSSHRT